jgi:hypothetical protein
MKPKALQDTHDALANILGPGAEPIDVLCAAERHRRFWRPDTTRVVLLAESHVYTSRRSSSEPYVASGATHRPAACSLGTFIRLGYGENALLDRPIDTPRNSGTPQYWKILQDLPDACWVNRRLHAHPGIPHARCAQPPVREDASAEGSSRSWRVAPRCQRRGTLQHPRSAEAITANSRSGASRQLGSLCGRSRGDSRASSHSLHRRRSREVVADASRPSRHPVGGRSAATSTSRE